MATAAKKQDMPPQGGYRPITFSRVPQVLLSRGPLILTHLAITAGGLYLYSLTFRRVEKEKVEQRSSMIAILPLLQAERDREYLKQLRRNREEEEKLMANVDGWVVGTYKGEPVFKTLPEDTLVKPGSYEYFIHAHSKSFLDYTDSMKWT